MPAEMVLGRVCEALASLGCPYLAREGEGWGEALLVEEGADREALLLWCLARVEGLDLVSSGTCLTEAQARAFLSGTMASGEQEEVWLALLPLLTCPEGDLQEEEEGLVEKVTEGVNLERQGRVEELSVTPFQLARELKGRKAVEVPSRQAVTSFLEEARGRRGEAVEGELEEQGEVDVQGLEEAFDRLDKVMEGFHTKYQVRSLFA